MSSGAPRMCDAHERHVPLQMATNEINGNYPQYHPALFQLVLEPKAYPYIGRISLYFYLFNLSLFG